MRSQGVKAPLEKLEFVKLMSMSFEKSNKITQQVLLYIVKVRKLK